MHVARAGPHTLPAVEPPPSQQITAACCDRLSLASPSVTSAVPCGPATFPSPSTHTQPAPTYGSSLVQLGGITLPQMGSRNGASFRTERQGRDPPMVIPIPSGLGCRVGRDGHQAEHRATPLREDLEHLRSRCDELWCQIAGGQLRHRVTDLISNASHKGF